MPAVPDWRRTTEWVRLGGTPVGHPRAHSTGLCPGTSYHAQINDKMYRCVASMHICHPQRVLRPFLHESVEKLFLFNAENTCLF